MNSKIDLVILRGMSGLALVCLAGCIPQQARNDARLMATLTSQVQAKGEQFKKSRDELDRTHQMNMDLLDQNRLELEQAAQHVLDVWTLAPPKAGSFDSRKFFGDLQTAMGRFAQQVEATRSLRAQEAAASATAHSAVAIQSDKLAAAAKALGQLATPPDYVSEVKFLIGYAQSVNDALRKAQAHASSQVAGAQDQAAKNSQAIAAGIQNNGPTLNALKTATHPAQPTTAPAQ